MREEFIGMLYEKYFETVKKYCLPKLRFDEAAAADCAHSVFDEAYAQAEKLQQHPNPLGWLMQTAKHKLHKRWRSETRETARNVPLELAAALPDSRDPFDAVELPESEIRRITAAVLSGLDEKERQYYELCFVRSLPFAQIAREMGVSEKAARAKLARIKLKLKQRIIYFLNE